VGTNAGKKGSRDVSGYQHGGSDSPGVAGAGSGAPKAPLYAWLAGELRDAIIDGRFKPGERLSNEAELGGTYGVGRSTVREALRVLLSEGLVVTLRGVAGGTFVVHPEPDILQERLEVTLRLLSITEQVTVSQLIETRACLELPSTRTASLHHTFEQLEVLRGTLVEPKAAVSAGRHYSANRDFHAIILEIAGNPLISATAAPIFSVLRDRFLRDAALPHFWQVVADEHWRIYDAIAAGDADSAVFEMERHLDGLSETYSLIDRAGRTP
jgi:GntR family transcriptional repressor for pyruvate dehydrogenase complex